LNTRRSQKKIDHKIEVKTLALKEKTMKIKKKNIANRPKKSRNRRPKKQQFSSEKEIRKKEHCIRWSAQEHLGNAKKVPKRSKYK